MAKPLGKGQGKLAVSTYFLLVILAFFVVSPLPGAEWAMAILGAFLYFPLKSKGIIKDFKTSDALLIPVYFMGVIIGFLVTGFISLSAIPWWKLLLFGIAIEAVSIGFSMFFPVPVISDFIQGVICFMIGMSMIGGLEGSMLSIFMFFILIIPGHIPGVQVGVLMLLKVISEVIL